jgi:hypothetical protein
MNTECHAFANALPVIANAQPDTSIKMTKTKIALFILSFLIFNTDTFAQCNIDSLRKANINTKIALQSLVGVWYTNDSLRNKITFADQGYQVCIQPVLAGVSNYVFQKDKDSVSVNGTASNWPPYNCILILKDSKTLEIKFFQYFYNEPYNVFFKRD